MAQQAMGTKIKIGTNSIAELTSISGLEMSADTIETTTLDGNGTRTFMQGLKDAGEVSISGYFNSADTNGQIAVYNAYDTGTLMDFSILFPATLGASWTFQGIVTAFKTGADLEDSISFEATIKVSGKPALGLTPSIGLFSLTVSGTGGTLSPAFNADTYSYAYTGLTGTNVTVTAMDENATIQLYINGVFSQTLTSASASAQIPMTVGTSKKLTIVVCETGKTQKVYEIVVTK